MLPDPKLNIYLTERLQDQQAPPETLARVHLESCQEDCRGEVYTQPGQRRAKPGPGDIKYQWQNLSHVGHTLYSGVY